MRNHLQEQAAAVRENEFEALTLTLEQLTTTYKDILDDTQDGQNSLQACDGGTGREQRVQIGGDD